MTRTGATLAALLPAVLSAACVRQAGPGGEIAESATRPVKLTILHVNDTHGWILPRTKNERGEPAGTPRIARAATLIRRIRQESGPGRTLLLHGGDVFHVHGEDRLASKTRGAAQFELMNRLGFDAMVLGNHELDFGLAHLRSMLALAEFPVVSANVREKATGEMLVEAHVDLTVGPVRVAVLGISPTYGSDKAAFAAPLDAAREFVPELRGKADLVLALTHIGAEEDARLAAEVPGIDVIVGGHTHTEIPRGRRVPNPGGGHTLVAQAKFRWEHLGRIDVTLTPTDGGYAVTSAEATLIPVAAAKTPPDPEVLDLIEELEEKAARPELPWRPEAIRAATSAAAEMPAGR